MNKKLYIESSFLVVLGIFTSFSLPPFNYVLLNFFTFSLLFIFLIRKLETSKNKKIFFFYGWLFGFGYFTSNLYWIANSLTFDDNFKFLIPFSILLVPGFISLFYGLFAYIYSILASKKILSSFFIFSVIFGIIEFFRGSILTGFPWNLIVFSFSNQIEILNILSLIGTYGFNLICISLFTSPAILILKHDKKGIGVFLVLIITLVSFYIYGSKNIERFNKSKKKGYDYNIRIIGSNISIDRFYQNIDPVKVIEELVEISSPQKDMKTIFVWPEGILPGISQENLVDYNWLFKNKFDENHILIIGINNKINDKQNIKIFNTLSVYDNNLNLIDSYKKINLVPFGEFIPFEKIFKKMNLKTITNNYQSFSKGNKRNIIEIKENNLTLKILPLICYEIIYSGKIFKSNNFDIIINISEDGWFGQSIGPNQHFIHSIFRSIESGKYVLRSANNGITAIINPVGIVEQKLSLNEPGYIDFNGLKEINKTLFSKYGNKIFGIIILLYIFLIFSFKKMKNE